MISSKPQFLSEFIHQNKSNILSTSISPNYLLVIFKDILLNFTTTFFTKLNYQKIFHSHYFSSPNSLSKRSQIAINLARLHLFLKNQYQTINYQKFYTDLNLKPIRMILHFNTILNNTNLLSLKIKNDSKYNIYIIFDISSQSFLQTFYIPSFNSYKTPFDEWFPKFFNSYKKQFLHINEQKVYNFIKYHIITYLTAKLKKLLPSSYQFPTVNSLKERTAASIKASLYHIHTCTGKTCNILSNNTPHTHHNLTSYYFHNSFSNYIYPYLDFFIFHLNQLSAATFTKPFPFKLFKTLAYSAEQKFIQLNNTHTNPKWQTFFYYTYFKYFLQIAVKNDNITDTTLKNALQTTISKTTDPHIIAKILAYFDTIHFLNTSISQIKSKYHQSYLLQAIQYITKKLQIPKISTDLFFPQFIIPDIPESLFLS